MSSRTETAARIASLGETIPTLSPADWADNLAACPTCTADRAFDDPADCPTCGGDRWV